jgi:hypothetical protein
VGNRLPNIIDLEAHRLENYNPLFDSFKNSFDNILLEKSVTDEYILENLYVDHRDNGHAYEVLLDKLFSSSSSYINRTDDLINEIAKNPGMAYLLIGKKGVGKTILLKKYISTLKKSQASIENTLTVYVDLKNFKHDEPALSDPAKLLVEEIHYRIKEGEDKYSMFFNSPGAMRQLDPIYEFIVRDEDLVRRVIDNKEESLRYLLHWAQKNSQLVFMIVDNLDDLPIKTVKAIVDKCIYLKSVYGVHCVLALRDYWHPKRLGIDDSHICSFYITKPRVHDIVRKRLNKLKQQDNRQTVGISLSGNSHPIELNETDMINIYSCIVTDLENAPDDLFEELYRLTNYNTREYIHNLYHFFHSPYLFSRPNFITGLYNKISSVDPDFVGDTLRPIKLFDFLECYMGVHTLCYDKKSSNIFNLFFHEWQYDGDFNYRNTLIFIRILQILPANLNTTYKCSDIINTLYVIGYKKDAIINSINVLLKSALIESPEGNDVKDIENVYISVKGLMYMDKILCEYTYITFMCDAVPMPEKYRVKDLKEKFGEEPIPLMRGSLKLKTESVQLFNEFINEEEINEFNACPVNYRDTLKRIRGDKGISVRMKEATDKAIYNMTKYGYSVKKPTITRFILKKSNDITAVQDNLNSTIPPV